MLSLGRCGTDLDSGFWRQVLKKTQFKDGIRNIRKRIVSYLSICLVIMLGTGVFFTMRFMEAGIGRKAAGYLTDRNYKDFEYITTLGSSEKTIESIKKIEGVTDAEGVMLFDGTLKYGDQRRAISLYSLTKKVSIPTLVEGDYPVGTDECIIGEDFSKTSGIEIGDRVSIALTGLDDKSDPLRAHEFKVTGLMMHPDFIRRGFADTVVLPITAFDMSETANAYTRVFVKTDNVPLDDFYDDRYFDITEPVRTGLEDAADALAEEREQELKDEANAEIDKTWEEAEAKLAEAEDEIARGRSELDSRLASGRKKLKDAEETLDKEIKKGSKSIKEAEALLNKVKKYVKEIDKRLPGIKKEIVERRSSFKDEIESLKAKIQELEGLIAELEKLPEWDEQTKQRVRELFNGISDIIGRICDFIEEVQEFLNRKTVQDIIGWIKYLSGGRIDLSGVVKSITDFDVGKIRGIVDQIADLLEKIENRDEFIAQAKDLIQTIKDGIKELEAFDKKLDEIEKYIALYEKNKDKYIAKAEKELREARKKLNSEKAKAEAKIRRGWDEYYSQKNKYEAKLAEAVALLAENREEAEKKLAEARAEVDKIEGKGLVFDRYSGISYIDVLEQRNAVKSASIVFSALFLLITGMVCLSTLTIIIEEQKKLLGTVKAFGFRKKEVLGKYLLFGGSAGIIGSILAFFGGTGLCVVVLRAYAASRLYQFGLPDVVFRFKPVIIVSACMIAVCLISTVIACNDILKSPASMLMKEETLRSNRAKNRKKKDASQRGTLYSRLILRNMRDDKARVIISTTIVAFCCILLGVGFNFKIAFTEMVNKHVNDVSRYDFRVDYGPEITGEQRGRMTAYLADSSADYTEASYESHIFKTDRGITGIQLIIGKADELPKFIHPSSGNGEAELTPDGILLPVKMSESYNRKAGDEFSLYDSGMNERTATISSLYTNYIGRNALMSDEAYEKVFEKKFVPNCCYVKAAEGSDAEEIKAGLMAVNEDITFSETSADVKGLRSIQNLYDIIVYVTSAIAILMSFMILTNLANIFLNRKKTELSVMRVNGFSIRQARGYLAKEAVITTIIGLIIGCALGAVTAYIGILILEPNELQFDRGYHPLAWILAAGIEGLFAFIIYGISFRKVKKLNLRDIAG